MRPLELIAALQPDIVLLDIKLPGIDGVALTRHIRETYPQTAIIIVSLFDDDAYLLRAIQAGAAAYCTKDMPISAIIQIVRRVAGGEILVDEILAARPSLAAILNSAGTALLQTNYEQARLSYREAEVLDGIVRGEGNKVIAQRLNISEQTVKSHVAAVLRQLGVDNRTSAAMTAVKRGWVNFDS